MIEYIIALVVGILVGLIGSGGAIVSIPAFVYLASYSTPKATDAALLLVLVSAIVAAIGYSKKKCIAYKDTLYFALSGMGGTFLGTLIHKQLGDRILLIILSVFLFTSAISMLFSDSIKKRTKNKNNTERSNIILLMIVGVIFGFITGLIGVGGGFIVIPLLTLVLHYEFKFAVGTSVVIILINAVSAVVFRVLFSNIEIISLLPLMLFAAFGAGIGIWLSSRLNQDLVKNVFIVFVLLIAFFTLIDNLVL